METAAKELPEVWFFLVEVEALDGGSIYVPGSSVLVQCLVPGKQLEPTLLALDAFLAEERYERTDLSIARRYRPGDEENLPPDTCRELVPEVAKTGKPDIALFIHARETATLLNPPTEESTPEGSSPEDEAPRKLWWQKYF